MPGEPPRSPAAEREAPFGPAEQASDGAGSRPAQVALVVALFSALAAVPYLVNAVRQPPDSRYTGIIYLFVDQMYYLAAQRSAARDLPPGNRFTAEPDAPGPVSALYPLMGEAEQAVGLPTWLAYHLPNGLGAMALPLLVYWLFRMVLAGRPRTALLATVLALFGAGAGRWFPSVGWAAMTADLQVPEVYPLFSVSVFPHFAVSWSGFVLCLCALAAAATGRRWWTVLLAAVGGGLLIGVSHPFMLLPVGIIGAGCWLGAVVVSRRSGPRTPAASALRRLPAVGVTIGLVALPFVLAALDEQARFEQAQGKPFPVVPPGPWWVYAAGLGVLTPLGVAALLLALHRRRVPLSVLAASLVAVVHVGLMYLPVTPFQRRFSEGLVLPLALLGAWALSELRLRQARLAVGGIVTVQVVGSVLTAVWLGAGGLTLSRDQQEVFAALTAQDVVLSSDEASNTAPAFSDVRAVVARRVETLHYSDKAALRREWLHDPTSRRSRTWLLSSGATAVVVDSHDDEFVVSPAVAARSCLRPRLRNERMVLYAVDRGCLRAAEG